MDKEEVYEYVLLRYDAQIVAYAQMSMSQADELNFYNLHNPDDEGNWLRNTWVTREVYDKLSKEMEEAYDEHHS